MSNRNYTIVKCSNPFVLSTVVKNNELSKEIKGTNILETVNFDNTEITVISKNGFIHESLLRLSEEFANDTLFATVHLDEYCVEETPIVKYCNGVYSMLKPFEPLVNIKDVHFLCNKAIKKIHKKVNKITKEIKQKQWLRGGGELFMTFIYKNMEISMSINDPFYVNVQVETMKPFITKSTECNLNKNEQQEKYVFSIEDQHKL